MAVDGADLVLGHTRQYHELEADRHEILADDVQARFRQQMMDIGDAAGDGVLDRNHGDIRLAAFQRHERILEGRAGQRLHGREHVTAGHVGIGAEIALEGDAVGLEIHRVTIMRGCARQG